MTRKKILVVDDERKLVDIVAAYLEKDGYKVITAYDGKSALEEARQRSPDLIILDLMLPEISGWDVCRILRAESTVPIIMLTAMDENTDKVVGLELGADDYMVKPFNPKELLARIRAVLRRTERSSTAQSVFEIGDLTIDLGKYEVKRGGRLIALTPTEFEILKVLAESPGRVYSRLQLLDIVQGEAYEGYERTIDSHVKNLRKKIEADPDIPIFVLTVRGIGYKLGEMTYA